MTIILAHNLEYTVRAVDKKSTPNQYFMGGASIPITMTTLVLLSLFSNGNWNIWERFVTLEDECVVNVLIVYNIYHIIR
jgi:hypothetical protein